jgi:hypothetical protein
MRAGTTTVKHVGICELLRRKATYLCPAYAKLQEAFCLPCRVGVVPIYEMVKPEASIMLFRTKVNRVTPKWTPREQFIRGLCALCIPYFATALAFSGHGEFPFVRSSYRFKRSHLSDGYDRNTMESRHGN